MFFTNIIIFLDFVIYVDDVHIDQSKMAKIMKWPPLKS
jgi:hypothetical protein